MKNDKHRLVKLTAAMALVFSGVLFFYILAFRKEDFNLQHIIFIGLVTVIFLFSMGIFMSKFKDVKKGLPMEDERSKKILNMASSRAFYVTMYWLLTISIFEKMFAGFVGQETLDAGQTVGGGILGMTIAFIAFWIYYNRKGNLV